MKVMYQGQEIELEGPEEGEKELDLFKPIDEDEDKVNLEDTMELTEEQIGMINDVVEEKTE